MTIKKDLIILGGGIAGLWLLNKLRNAGYSAILLEHASLGSGQTIASQGMIHGGLKYALGGVLTDAAETIADMPAYWKQCLAGEGDVDLRGTRVLSDTYYMWPKDSLRSRFNAFLGSKAIQGKVSSIAESDWPVFFQGRIRGPLYRLHDIVLDVPSVLVTLSERCRNHIYRIDREALDVDVQTDGITLQLPDGRKISARRMISTAGAGNEELCQRFGLHNIRMQRRPLQMVVVKHHIGDPLYVHCVADQLSATPELTITTHQCRDGSTAWYLGGELAESGVALDQAAQINAAGKKLAELFPWCDFSTARWHSFHIDRAEASQAGGKRPDNCSVLRDGCFYICWPTKLTLAPALANSVLEMLRSESVLPGSGGDEPVGGLPFPGIAQPPWDCQ